MMKSPTNHIYEGRDYIFDPIVDFSQFLEEAKKHKAQEQIELGPQCGQQIEKKQSSEDKKKKQSWKRSFLSLWKLPEKKNNSKTGPPARSHSTKAGHGGRVSASGPLYESVSGPRSRSLGPRSGPLASFFVPNKKVENEKETPYMCLDKLNDFNAAVESYGPVYLVT